MENTQNNMEGKTMGVVSIVAGVTVLIALIWWINKQPQVSQQASVTPTPDTESASINQGIDGINVSDLNAEFEIIDKDLLGL